MSKDDKFNELYSAMIRAEYAFLGNPTDENKEAYEKAHHELTRYVTGERLAHLQRFKARIAAMKQAREAKNSESRKTAEIGRAFGEGLAEGMKIAEKE